MQLSSGTRPSQSIQPAPCLLPGVSIYIKGRASPLGPPNPQPPWTAGEFVTWLSPYGPTLFGLTPGLRSAPPEPDIAGHRAEVHSRGWCVLYLWFQNPEVQRKPITSAPAGYSFLLLPLRFGCYVIQYTGYSGPHFPSLHRASLGANIPNPPCLLLHSRRISRLSGKTFEISLTEQVGHQHDGGHQHVDTKRCYPMVHLGKSRTCRKAPLSNFVVDRLRDLCRTRTRCVRFPRKLVSTHKPL